MVGTNDKYKTSRVSSCTQEEEETRVTNGPESSEQAFAGRQKANVRTAAEMKEGCALPNPW